MNRFKELLESVDARPISVVHLGAGLCNEFEIYKSIGANRIIFVEPDPKLAVLAKNRFKDNDEVTVLECAIATEAGQETLNVTDKPDFSSLLLPDELLNFYPKVSVIDKVEVATLTLGDLIEKAKISNETDSLLITEIQGMEDELFPLISEGVLHKFKWIIIRTSKNNLYKPRFRKLQKGKDISTTLCGAGYMVFSFNEINSPFQNILCIRNDAELENARLVINQHKLSSLIDQKSDEQIDAQSRFKGLAEKYNQTQAEVLELQQTVQANKELAAKYKRAQDEVTQLQQDLQVNSKLMLKSDADLKDLQSQYRAVQQAQEEHNTLYCDLKEKLRQAAEYYTKLNYQNLVFDEDMLEQTDTASVESLGNDNKD